jgi:hypothetical protein
MEEHAAVYNEYRRLKDASDRGEQVSKSELDEMGTILRRVDRKLKLAQWDEDINRAAMRKANLDYILQSLEGDSAHPTRLGKLGRKDISTAVAHRMLVLQARRMSSVLRDAFRPGMEGIAALPKVVLEKTANNQTKGAHYRESDNTLHLDCLFGDWNGLPGTAQHEFGHWFDYKFLWPHPGDRMKGVDAAKSADLDALFRKPGKRSSGQYSEAEKITLFGNDDNNRSGTFWECKNLELFGHTRGHNTDEENNVITGYADTMESLTQGRFGWGHGFDYAHSKHPYYEEAVAEAYMAYARGDLKFRDTYPELWRYITEEVKKVEKSQSVYKEKK